MKFKSTTILITLILLTILITSCSTPIVVEEGDTISVLYVGSLENGTVFDTNIIAKAQKAGIYNSQRNYEPLTFTVGSGQMIQGFENTVKGMELEQTKTVIIPPTEAYGKYDSNKVVKTPSKEELDRIMTLDNTLNIPASSLLALDPKVGVGYEFTDNDMDYKIVEEKGDTFVVKMIPKVGQTIALPNVAWEGTIISETENEITVRQDPVLNKVYNTKIGPLLIEELTQDKIMIRLAYEEGNSINTPQGVGKITAVNNEEITVDFNHKLAGKNLEFQITVVDIKKKE